jgi:CAAX protease family protein
VGLGSVALEFTLHWLWGGKEQLGLAEGDAGADIAWPGTLTFLARAFVVLAIFPFQAAAEEFLFRGTFLQAVGAWLPSRWYAIAVSAGLFGLAHGTDPPV